MFLFTKIKMPSQFIFEHLHALNSSKFNKRNNLKLTDQQIEDISNFLQNPETQELLRIISLNMDIYRDMFDI